MQSIFGALLTAGYASAVATLIAASPDASQISDSTESALTKSFSSASNLASGYPEQTQQAIVSGARTAFLDGQDWAYTAGLVAIVLGAVLVYFMFPKHQREEALLAEYHRSDSAARAEALSQAGRDV